MLVLGFKGHNYTFRDLKEKKKKKKLTHFLFPFTLSTKASKDNSKNTIYSTLNSCPVKAKKESGKERKTAICFD